MTLLAPSRPRLGFLGVGWIGRHRLNAGRVAIARARRLSGQAAYDPENCHLITVAEAIDAIYDRQEA